MNTPNHSFKSKSAFREHFVYWLLAIITCLGCSAAAAPNKTSIQYRLTLTNDLANATIDLCRSSSVDLTLSSSHEEAIEYIATVSKGLALSKQSLTWPAMADNCQTISVDLSRYRTNNRYSYRHKGDSSWLRIPSGLLVFRPGSKDETAQLTMTIDKEYEGSYLLPWRQTSKDTYLVDRLSFMSVPLYFGDFNITKLSKTYPVNVGFLGRFNQSQMDKITRWLAFSYRHTARSLNLKNSDFAIVVTRSSSDSSEAVPYAMVARGEGTLLRFIVNPTVNYSDLIEDWTSYHEFSHLGLPFIDRREAWVSEGFASLWQYRVMTNAGVLPPINGLRRFWGGIRRGIINHKSSDQMSLDRVTSSMSQYRAHRRVYWTGALLWFKLEQAFNQQGKSLTQTIVHFNNCCRSKYHIWSAKQLAKELDELLDSDKIQAEFTAAKSTKAFPDYQEIFNGIDVSVRPNQTLSIGNEKTFLDYFNTSDN
ncbi:MAG: hypothetical protein V2I33_15220 [Kangiellaceae bacterium]|jgi:hypothetical protein|nr:hypothetical protein [Kangiellaceae bacterium]